MAEGTINIVARDIKSPRDLCLHLQARGLPFTRRIRSANTRPVIERIRNEARNFDGPSPVTPDGRYSEVGMEDLVGTCLPR